MPRLVDGLEQVFTDLGIVGAGYKLFFFETTTTTPKTTYSDVDLTVANPNPVVCDASGRPEYDIWGADPSTYKMILGTPDSVIGDIDPIATIDPVNDLNSGSIIIIDPLPTAYWGLTTGTSTAYILNPALVPITSYSIKQCFLIDIHTSCGAEPTLDVNTVGAVSIKKRTGQGTKVLLQEGDLQPGRYLAFYDGTDFVFYNTRGEALYLGSPVTLEESSNAITITNQSANYLVDTSSSDITLNTINGLVSGEKIVLGISDDSNTLTLTNGIDNIINPSGSNIVLSNINDKVELISDGTNSIIISSNNSNDNPLKLLETKIASSSSSLDFISQINDAFSKYIFEFNNILPAADAPFHAQLSINGGSSYIATNYYGVFSVMTNVDGIASVTGSTTLIDLSYNTASWYVESTSTKGYNGKLTLDNPSSSASHKTVDIEGRYMNASGNYTKQEGAQIQNGTSSPVNAIKFYFTGQNIASGTINMYGLK